MIFYVLTNAGGGVCFSTIELTIADGFLGFRCFQKVCSIHVMRESIFVVSLQFCEIKKYDRFAENRRIIKDGCCKIPCDVFAAIVP